MRKPALVFAAVVLWPVAATAVTLQDFSLQDGQDLVDLCDVKDGDPLYNEAMSFCFGFFTGAMHFHRGLVRGPDVDPLFCPENPVSRQEAVATFLAWAKRNPDDLQDHPIEGAVKSAVERWPCE